MALDSTTVGSVGERFERTVDARWVMSYAAGIGDYLPCYMDTSRRNALRAHPLFPVRREWPVLVALRDEAGQEPAIACATYPTGSTLRSQVLHQGGRFDDTIIDAGGRDSTALRAALVLSDVLLVPFHPRSYDVWALDDMAALVDEARAVRGGLKVKAVLNCADPGERSRDNGDAAAAVGELPQFEYLPAPLRRRKAFANAAGAGLSVLEISPLDRKAIAELNALVAMVF